MSRAKPKGLPFACVRRPLFPKHVDDVILSDERLVAIAAPVTSWPSQALNMGYTATLECATPSGEAAVIAQLPAWKRVLALRKRHAG